MEFWGVEVKAGQPLKVSPEEDRYLHLSQAALGEFKKDKGIESVTIFVKIGDQKLVLGILSPEKFPQLSFDLVFEKEFELSHNWKNGSVHFCGYQAFGPEEDGDDTCDEFDSGSSSEEETENLPVKSTENGKPGPKVEEAKLASKANAAKPVSSEKPKVKLVEPSKDEDNEDESDEDDEDDEDDSEDESDEDMLEVDSDDEDDDEEDEETPKKAEVGKKRLNESATKTPVPAKKAKSASPQKTDGKKGAHTATPHPAKKNAAKTPANSGAKGKNETPKSGGPHSCKSCSKTFSSDVGLQSHTKAKHEAK